MLYDSEFLRELDEQREKTVYARIISLDLEENPLQLIEGLITSGSVNVDGNSAVRRTCSLSMVARDINIDDYYWGLHTKFKLEIGVENTVSRPQYFETYPKIIWFKMGTYVITSFSCLLSTNSYTISIQGKDKMCLLNGDVGGVINARTDFGTYDYYDVETGITTNRKYPIKKIIWDAVHAYANEPFHNIILNDLDELGLELLDYKYDIPMYLIRPANTNDVYSVAPTLNGDMEVLVDGVSKKISEVRFERLIDYLVSDSYSADKITLPNSANPELKYFVAKIEYGLTCGYRTCELVYAGDLIANVGESLTSVLDKLKAMLGEFEYFYDLDGRFIFLRKKCLVNTDWSPQRRGEDKLLYVLSLAEASNSIYTFNGSILISSFSNSPNLGNLKNDFTVWGERTSVGGNKYPIHMRYAIDNKPSLYVDYDGNAWTTKTMQEIADENGLKARYATMYDYEALMDKFEKDPSLYPQGFDTSKDNKWWNMKDWAEYYAILFGEPPGNKHPDDEMQYYTKPSNYRQAHIFDFINGFRVEYGLQPLIDTGKGTICCAIGICSLNGLYSVQDITDHIGCVHTYQEWLDMQYYVNGTNTTRPFDPTYLFADGYSVYSLIDYNHPLAEDEIVPPGSNRRIITISGTRYFYYPNTKIALDEYWRELKGLIKVFVYVWDPEIPPERAEKYLEEQIEKIEYEDPLAGKYKQVDWREIIYRMAIDYRRHNHDDDFEVALARRNYPLYPNGVTGYEQYYIDLEGFWRLLYCPMFDDDEKKGNYELEFKQYNDITDKNDLDKIYVKGVYKPLAQKVIAVMEGRLKPGDILGSNDRYYHKENIKYFTSENNGFTFTEFTPADDTEWVEKCVEGKVYTRLLTDLSNTFKIHQGLMQPYGNTINFLEDGHYYFLKVMNLSDPLNPTYELINVNTKLTPEQKLLTYHSLVEDGDDIEFTLDRRLRLAQARSNPWADLYIYDNKTYCMADIVLNSSLKNLYYDSFAQLVKQYLLESPTALNSNLTAALKKNVISYYVAYIDFYVDPPVYELDADTGKYNLIAANDGEKVWWHKDVFDYPDLLNFWFDFLEGDGTLRQFTTKAVGDRPKAVNETTIKSIYYRDTPKVIYSTMSKYQSEDYKTGYSYFIIPDSGYENMFAISPQGISAKNRTDELLYQHSYCTESVNLTAVPIYYLEPNNRVYIFDEKTGINGYYVISKLSYSLAYNGMMQVTATKAPENSILEREE